MVVRSEDLLRLMQVAGGQAGVLSAEQAVASGVTRRQIRDGARIGVLHRIHPSVYWIGSGPPTRAALLHAAVLAVGADAVPSHESALYLHGVDHVPFEVVVSAARSARTDLPSVRVHRVGDLHPSHRCEIGGLTTTTLERALVDATSVFSVSRIGWLLDELTIRSRRTSLGRLSRTLRQVNRRGRKGIGAFASLLDDRGPREPQPRSLLERAADELLAGTSLPDAEREYPLPHLLPAGASADGFVDRAWPEAKLIVEVDGRRWHARERDMASDRRRDRQAAAAGWQTLRVLDEEIRDLPDEVAAEIVAAYSDRVEGHRVEGHRVEGHRVEGHRVEGA